MARLTFFLCGAAFCTLGPAQEERSIRRFGTFEVSTENPQAYADPYGDVASKARFKGPTGEAVRRPANTSFRPQPVCRLRVLRGQRRGLLQRIQRHARPGD